MRRNKIKIVISTDLLSRGIDIAEIDFIINYDMPQNIETYFHRVGNFHFLKFKRKNREIW